MQKEMVFEGWEEGYRVYKNADGFMEGYKKVGKSKIKADDGSDVKRIVTNQTTLSGFGKYVRGLRKSVKTKDKPVKAGDLPSLFSE